MQASTRRRQSGNRAAGSWCPDDNIIPWSAPEERRNSWEASRLQEYEDDITPRAYRDDDRIAEVFTSRMREVAERKEAKAERKRAALAAIRASLLVGGWLCPGCNEWNLSFRNLCYRCNGKRTAAGVLSRGVPDPRRDEQDRDESDSDDSAAIDGRPRGDGQAVPPLHQVQEGLRLEEAEQPAWRSLRRRLERERGVAQQRGLVSVWLRPLASAPAWCAAPFPSACRRGPSGARHPSGLRPQGATAPAEWLGRPWQQRPTPGH